ncbi:protein mkt1 [Anaeramoeba ignava]|uniref:Protein mkt1 n=1 Tax=Anaeramoeba ignava TaxID=1746090 RepID=A0A9Q0LNC8_ANAIG|nr:protein mkt1 [Anaeramoeba ignava]
MSIRYFRQYAQQNFPNREDIINLSGKRIGIDGFYFLKNLEILEPLQQLTGGIPLTFEEKLQIKLDFFKNHNIEVLFVFNGADIRKKEEIITYPDLRTQSRLDFWRNNNHIEKINDKTQLNKNCGN